MRAALQVDEHMPPFVTSSRVASDLRRGGAPSVRATLEAMVVRELISSWTSGGGGVGGEGGGDVIAWSLTTSIRLATLRVPANGPKGGLVRRGLSSGNGEGSASPVFEARHVEGT